MAISGDYSRLVTVNGFACRNCTDVDLAQKHIDPAHPKDGPYGVNAKSSARHGAESQGARKDGASSTIVLDGAFLGLKAGPGPVAGYAKGDRVNLLA